MYPIARWNAPASHEFFRGANRTDLGLVLLGEQPTDEATGSGQLMGTLQYMAPEQAEAAHRVDHRADIYSLGCTLYHLLVGQSLYSRRSLTQMLVAHREAAIPSLRQVRPEVPAALDTAFQKMVAKRPEGRHQHDRDDRPSGGRTCDLPNAKRYLQVLAFTLAFDECPRLARGILTFVATHKPYSLLPRFARGGEAAAGETGE
ncbi:MAG: protein kinase [Planctomycetota bacterium]|nr:protein kinase [Planctomycetota bacterium]